jgi:phospholipid/cholesterol/gamma-HCH transport system permease protein
MAESGASNPIVSLTEAVGRRSVGLLVAVRRGVEEIGQATALLGESLFWLIAGRYRHQPVRIDSVIDQMMDIGIRALPVGTLLSLAIGVTLAMQGIDLLQVFGAESQVVLGVALSVSREFSPLIMGILIAGRSGSALTARLGTMMIGQEIDALRVMGINPVRFLVVPALVAMVIMLPLLTFWSMIAALFGAATYTYFDLGMSYQAFADTILGVLDTNHVMHGVAKSAIFAVLIGLIGVVNGLAVSGGAEGVGRATTRSVVISITAIIVTDMLFIFILTR